MAGQAEASAALATVVDPELRRPVVDLAIARGVAVDGDLAVVTLVPPLEDLGYRGRLTGAITDALTAVDGIGRVEFDVSEPSETELTALAAALRGVATHVPRANLLYSPRNKILATALLTEAFLYEEQTRRGVSLRHWDEFGDVADLVYLGFGR